VLPYCVGNGIEIGTGGDPIVHTSIQIELPPADAEAYTATDFGVFPAQLRGDGTNLYWFRDRVFDYLASSHLLEDFYDWRKVLMEWMRVVKVEGRLILLVPEEKLWAQAVDAGQPMNHNHDHEFTIGELSGFVGAQFGWVVEAEQMAAPEMLTDVGTPDFTILFVARRVC
jgi:SAM-dependent methyltransferase